MEGERANYTVSMDGRSCGRDRKGRAVHGSDRLVHVHGCMVLYALGLLRATPRSCEAFQFSKPYPYPYSTVYVGTVPVGFVPVTGRVAHSIGRSPSTTGTPVVLRADCFADHGSAGQCRSAYQQSPSR